MITNAEELKARIDVVDTVSNLVALKKAGANFKACCPFHGEDTPSLVVSPQKQIWHCFGCGAGGDAISFVQDFCKLSYTEALERIANDLNFTLTYNKSGHHIDYTTTMEFTNTYYKLKLIDDKLHYLLDRGITRESIKCFEIGFAPSSKEQYSYLTQNTFTQEEAIETGIMAKEKDKLFARLTHRITFPIRNHANKLIGFGGRIIDGDRAKYINSPQTKLFDKSRNLYGYNIAKEHIYRNKNIIITEGYLDVVMLHQAGFKTAVATMGTALTSEHCLMIQKADVKVLLCYDGDNAGRTAGFKASKLLCSYEIDGGVILFDEGIDPADMVKAGRTNELEKIMKNSIPIVQYVLQFISNTYDLSNPYEKNKALKECKEFLATLNPVIADEYRVYLAKLLHIEMEHLKGT
ncbi:MAG: DNA primase, partial [Sulfurospirillum sp.]